MIETDLKKSARLGACFALVLIGCSTPTWAQSVYICTYDELLVCGEGLGCTSEGADDIDMPRRVKVDIAGATLSSLDDAGNLREAKAQTIEQRDGVYFLQAVQRTRREGRTIVGWTVFLDPSSMRLSGSAVSADLVFNVFGSCQEQ